MDLSIYHKWQTHRKKLLPPGVAFKLEVELVASANEAVSSTAAADVVELTFGDVSVSIPSVQIMYAIANAGHDP